MNRVEKIKAIQEMKQEDLNAAQQAIEQLLARSATDYPFRQQLLTNPRAAIAEHTGTTVSEIPASFNLVFIENDATATFVLPDPISTDELADADLEAVAGGTGAAEVFGVIAIGMFIVDTAREIWKAGVEAGKAAAE